MSEQVGEELDKRHESTTKKVVKSAGKLATKLTIFGTLGLFGGAALSTVVPTEVPFGPGTARATLTFDGNATVDAGIIGGLQKDVDSPGVGPVQLGANIRVNELPIQDTGESSAPIDELSVDQLFGSIDTSDLHRYAEYSRATGSQVGDISNELKNHLLKLGFLVGISSFALYELPGRKGRRVIIEQLKKPSVYLPVLVALYAGNLAIPLNTVNADSHNWQETDSEYDGTALEDVRISGDIANQFVNNFGGRILKFIRSTDEFYDHVLANAENVATHNTLLGQRPQDQSNQVFMFFTDNHCNTGTPETIAYLASEAGAQTAVDGGDTVFSGSGYEMYCVQQQMAAFNRHDIEVVAVQGNHDSDTTAEFMEHYGAHMLTGDIQEINGLRFLGDTDPFASRLGQGIQLRGDRTVESLGTDLADTACVADEPAILVVHHEDAATESLTSGCVYLSLSGHTRARGFL